MATHPLSHMVDAAKPIRQDRNTPNPLFPAASMKTAPATAASTTPPSSNAIGSDTFAVEAAVEDSHGAESGT